MKKISIRTSPSYGMLIDNGILAHIGEYIDGQVEKVAVITDDTVGGLYADAVEASLQKNGVKTVRFSFPSGEKSKTTEKTVEILEFLADNELTRSDAIVALGGGVVGDLAGFAAACYLRGIKYYSVPTTLLAMVDSSVGGKTGCNLSRGKNLVGAFCQPSAVLCDTAVLATLPKRVFLEGIAEAIKTGAVADKVLFGLLEKGENEKNTDTIIERCVAAKTRLVVKDERDRSVRRLLNFGHTVAHAVEKASEYEVAHGYAVALGMVAETKAALELGFCSQKAADRIRLAVEANGFPTTCEYEIKQLVKAARLDKKRSGDKVAFAVPRSIGKGVIFELPADNLEDYFKAALR